MDTNESAGKKGPEKKNLPEVQAPDPRSFPERLRYVLNGRSIGHVEFSEMVGTNLTHIRQCVKGTGKVSAKRIRKMANALDISPEWLAGEEDKPLAFNDKLRQKLSEGEWNRKKLSKATEIPHKEIFQYTVGASFPTIEQLRKMAEVLEVTPQWLAGNQ